MFTAIVLVCSVLTTPLPSDCTKDNAVDVMIVGNESSDPLACMKAGQDYIKSAWMHRAPQDNEIIVIHCIYRIGI